MISRFWINNASKRLSRNVSSPERGWNRSRRVISPRVTINNACDRTQPVVRRDSGKFVPAPIVEEGDSSPACRGWWMKMRMHLREIYKARMSVTGRPVNEPVRQRRKRSISSRIEFSNFYIVPISVFLRLLLSFLSAKRSKFTRIEIPW